MISRCLFARTGEMLPMKVLAQYPAHSKCSVESHLRLLFHAPDETLRECDLPEFMKTSSVGLQNPEFCFCCLPPLEWMLPGLLSHCFFPQSSSSPLIPSSCCPTRQPNCHFPAPGSTLRSWFLMSNTPGPPFPFCGTLNLLPRESECLCARAGHRIHSWC